MTLALGVSPRTCLKKMLRTIYFKPAVLDYIGVSVIKKEKVGCFLFVCFGSQSWRFWSWSVGPAGFGAIMKQCILGVCGEAKLFISYQLGRKEDRKRGLHH